MTEFSYLAGHEVPNTITGQNHPTVRFLKKVNLLRLIVIHKEKKRK